MVTEPENNVAPAKTVWVKFYLTDHAVAMHPPVAYDWHSVFRTNLPTVPHPSLLGRPARGNAVHPHTFKWEDSDTDSRTFVEYIAEMTDAEYAYFDELWSISEAEKLYNEDNAVTTYVLDGMDWNVSGYTPFEYVEVMVQ